MNVTRYTDIFDGASVPLINWQRWKRRFQQFREASGIKGEPASKQVNTLLYCMGEEAEAVLASTKATEDNRKTYATVLAKFDAFFQVRKNVIYEHARLNRRNQQSRETAEEYIMALYNLVESCDYGDDIKEEMIRDRLVVGIRVFSKLDANSGFWQIPLSQSSRLLTIFITPVGRYCFNKLSFGISSAPEHFQRRVSEILSGLKGVLCQMDDVLIFGKDEAEHDRRLEAALRRIQDAGVTLNPQKCEFRKRKLTFLGNAIDKNGIIADPRGQKHSGE